jgi:hypothetical protein
MEGFDGKGYGYADYSLGAVHSFITTSYGLSLAKPHALLEILEQIPDIRIFMYQERGWGGNHDVLAYGKPSWNPTRRRTT